MKNADQSCVDDRAGLVIGGTRPRWKFVLGHDDRLHRVPAGFDRLNDPLPPFSGEGAERAAAGVGVASWLGSVARCLPGCVRV